jgi:excisionase family DNA binding protein
MLMHEWLRHRDRHLVREAPPEAEAATPEPVAEAEPTPAETAPEPTPEEAVARTLELLQALPAEEEPEEAAPEPVEAPRPAPLRVPTAPSDLRAPEVQSRRLQLLVGRQQRLPLEVEEAEPPARGSAASESREELIERLLDPVLSIEETSTLLGVCATSVRRYTNRGVLKCFRTPGNQRRFRLSDVLDFMEKQQSSTLD